MEPTGTSSSTTRSPEEEPGSELHDLDHEGRTLEESALPFLEEVIRRLLDSWSEDSFLDREAAEMELRAIAEWLQRGTAPGSPPPVLSDRLLTRRFSEILLYGILTHWEEKGREEDATGYLRVLASLSSLPSSGLGGPGEAFARRLTDPDGFELMTHLGHDIRSPLTSITFLAETLRSGHSGPVNEHQQAQLGLIYSASVGLGSIVSDVVDLARTRGDPLEAEPQPFSIFTILDSVAGVVGPMAEAKGVEFRTKVTTHDRVRGHPMALSRVILNLAINGLKFTEHGWVEVTAYPEDRDRVEFSVRDTGRGIPPENRENLFQPFRKSAARTGSFFSSSGLGLCIAQRFLLAMGSELQMESRPGWGTRFFFVLDAPSVTHL